MKKTVIFKKWTKIQSKLISLLAKMEKNGIKTNLSWVTSEVRDEIKLQTIIFDNDETLRSDSKTEKIAVEVIDIEFFGEVPKINGWEIIGRMEKLENGVLTFGYGNDLDVKYTKHNFKNCEHCGHKRSRKEMFVLSNEGETKVVGTSCVKDFTGHKDVKSLLAFLSYLDTIDSREKFMDYGVRVTDTKEFIELCAQSILDFNYNKSDSEMSTKDRVLTDKIEVTDLARKLAKEAINRAQNFSESELKNEFNRNLKLISEQKYLKNHQLGLASYLVEYHRVQVNKEIAKKAELKNKSNEYVGELKDRKEFNLTYLRSSSFETEYGISFFHTFEDEKGNLVIWKGSTNISWAYNKTLESDQDFVKHSDELLGRSFKIVGTVSKLDDFRDRKQTYINRCKIILA